MFRAFRVRGPVLKKKRPSSHTPQTGMACGMPAEEAVEIQ
jgi:hypothetical protein